MSNQDLTTDEFDYHLPPESIAQTPVEPRDSARLLHIDRGQPVTPASFVDYKVRDLPDLLRPGDTVVVNDSRVLPARIAARRATGGKVELLLLARLENGDWTALAKPARRLVTGERVIIDGVPTPAPAIPVTAEIVGVRGDGIRVVSFSDENAALAAGQMPLPPYITERLTNPDRYQTVYARALGSAAAPTAGLHISPDLLERLAERGIAVQRVTLHVGLDTFRPVNEESPAEHKIHSEWCEVSAETAAALNQTRRDGGRIVAIGTTSVRTLESATDDAGTVRPYAGSTRLYILPGYRFRAVDAMMTNFHLPRSTLLMLVSAFAGRERMLAAYQEAIRRGYRFFSFGDAMLIT